MIRSPFENVVKVEIQGPRVLELLARGIDYAEYDVLGFDGTVIIRDYRSESLAALDCALNGVDVDFGEKFSTLAYAIVSFPSQQQIHIELHPTTLGYSVYTLWIAIGLEDFLPVLNYLMRKIEPVDDHGYAVIALFQHSSTKQKLYPSSSPSLTASNGGHDIAVSSSL